jgi:hypothetical protein
LSERLILLQVKEAQEYLRQSTDTLCARLISRPIRRKSRLHRTPLSLEALQTFLIKKNPPPSKRYKLTKKDVVDSFVFQTEVEEDDDWEKEIEDALKSLGAWTWMRCPSCLSTFI